MPSLKVRTDNRPSAISSFTLRVHAGVGDRARAPDHRRSAEKRQDLSARYRVRHSISRSLRPHRIDPMPLLLGSCYTANMTKEQLKKVLDRVLTWPPERQEDAAEILTSIEAQDRSPYRLTDEQAAEVRRRLADPNSKTVPFEEVFERYPKGE
jgi:hypothetical protein